jgi:hypothetical protein
MPFGTTGLGGSGFCAGGTSAATAAGTTKSAAARSQCPSIPAPDMCISRLA